MTLRVIAGSLHGLRSPVATSWETIFADVLLKAGATMPLDADHEERAVYVISGEIEITSNNGKRSLVAKNTKGETIFDGPIDTEEQRKALPEDLRKKIESIEVQTKVARTRQEPFGNSGPAADVQ